MENLNYKNENIERKYLKNMRKNQFLKVKNSHLEPEKDFIELKDRQLKDREVKVKRELSFKPIIMSIDDMDSFEQKEVTKLRPIKNIWYDWLINHMPEPIRKSADGFKVKIVSPRLTSFRQTSLNKSCMGEERNLANQKLKTL